MKRYGEIRYRLLSKNIVGNISSQINSYNSGKDFMKNPDANLLFLDIELAEGEDGFEIAEQLMNLGNKCKVCF